MLKIFSKFARNASILTLKHPVHKRPSSLLYSSQSTAFVPKIAKYNRNTIKTFINREGNGAKRIVGHWLMGVSGLVFGIVVIGGLTRLTESGLSMVDWSLLHFRAPQSQEDWQAYFEKYQQFPEYQKNNQGMTLDEFKLIYWMEHVHRVYGRLLGLAVLVPSVVICVSGRRWVGSVGIKRVLGGCCLLVGFQGLLGWWMVKSGLDPALVEEAGGQARVSPYRLAAHLGSAITLYLITLSLGVRILSNPRALALPRLPSAKETKMMASLPSSVHKLAGLTFVTAITGAFVAGLDAGLLYNTFPLMEDRFVPSDVWDSRLSLRNFTENPSCVQFIHRSLAMTTVASISVLWLKTRRLPLPTSIKKALNLVMGAAWLQGSLGVCTLLYMVPIPLASAHQAGSVGLLSTFVWLISRLKRLAH